MPVQQRKRLACGTIPDPQPIDLPRRASQKAQLLEVRILGKDAEPIVTGMVPKRMISSAIEAQVHGMHGTRIAVLEMKREGRREVVVDQELHAAGGIMCSLRSRSPA